MRRELPLEAADPSWRPLYLIGAVAAFAAVILFRPHLSAEISLLRSLGLLSIEPPPGGPQEWFTLLENRPLLGLLLLDVGDLVNYALVGLVFLALFGALREARWSSMLIAAGACLVGITVYFATNPAFAMLSLSRQYAAATEARKAALLAAAQAILAGSSSYVSVFLIHLAGLIGSMAMLRSRVFGSATAVTGLLSNGLYLMFFPALALAPSWIALPPSLSAPFRLTWYLLIAIRLLRLARNTPARLR